MRRVLELVFDRGSVFELGRRFGGGVITALARLDGRPVGVIANDPKVYGGWLTADASEKLARYIDLCDQFRLPVVNLVDQPGLPDRQRGRAPRDRSGAAPARCAPCARPRCPWCSVLVRKCFGIAGAGHGDGSRLNLRFAWPSGDWGSLPLAGGIEAAFKRVIAESRRPRGDAGADRRAAAAAARPVPDRRALLDRGDRRPAGDPAAAVRLRRSAPTSSWRWTRTSGRAPAVCDPDTMHPLSDPAIEKDVRETQAAHAAGEIQLVDVRERYEWDAGRIDGAEHIELERLSSRAADLDKDRPVVFVCRGGVRSLMAAQAFKRGGYDAWSMRGGMSEWHAAGLPMVPEDGHVADH